MKRYAATDCRPRFVCGLALRVCQEIEKALLAGSTRAELEAQIEAAVGFERGAADRGEKPARDDRVPEASS